MLSWRTRRQLIAFLIFTVPLAVFSFWLVAQFLPESSCFDNHKNQGEVGVDCGGPCAPCELKNPKPVTLFWARVVPVREDSYDAVAQIQNPNEVLSSAQVQYEFTIFDDFAPVATRRGTTFLFAQERTYVVESNIKTVREPTRVEFKITNIVWQFRQEQKPNLVVERRDYRVERNQGRKQSVVEARILNRTVFDFKEMEIRVVILDKEENLLGSSRTVIEEMKAGSSRTVKFLWPEELRGNIGSVIVEPRVNIFDANAVNR